MAGKCIFNNSWLEKPEYKTWLQRNVSDVYTARCTMCYKNFSVASMGESAVKSHAKSRKHIDLLSIRISKNVLGSYFNDKITSEIAPRPQQSMALSVKSETSDINTIESHVAKNDVLDAEILWTLKTVKNHGSYKANENIEKIFHRMFPDSSIARKFSCGEKKTAYYAVFGIAPYLENLLQENLNKKKFVLLFDESLNIMKQEKQMDIHIRFWQQNRVSTVYFNSIFLGHSSSSDIYEAFMSSIVKLKFSKAIQISMDGPNVNWKFYGMLQDFYSTEFGKNLLNIGSCGLHIMHNAFKAGCIESAWGIVDFLTALYYLLKNSPARRDDFLKESKGALPQKFIQHRWLDNVPASEAAINLLPSIKKYVSSVDKGDHKKPSCKSYNCIKNNLNDILLSVKLKVFHSIAKVLHPFLTKYQTDKPMLFFLSEDLKKCVNLLLQRFVLPNNLNAANTWQKILSLDISNPKIHKQAESIDLGFSAEKEVQSLNVSKKISDHQVFDLRMGCKKFLIKVTMKLLEKSPVRYSIVRNLSCLDPRNMSDKKKCLNKMKHILNSLVEAKHVDETVCEEVLMEFDDYLNNVALKHSEFSPENLRTDEFFFETMNVSKYKNLWNVVEMLLLLSHGQATVEKGFSINKKIEVENMKNVSYIAQRLICDYVNSSGGNIHDIKITNTMRTYVSNARQKYMTYLEDMRLLSSQNKKRKILTSDEIEELKNKKRCLEKDIKALIKSADEFAQKAEENNDLSSICKSNSLRRSAKEKEEKLFEITKTIENLLNG